MLQKLYPKAESANCDGFRVDVYAEEAILDNGLFLVKQGLLNALGFWIFEIVLEQLIVSDYNKFIVFSGSNTDWFYQEVAKVFIEENPFGISCTAFDLRDYEKLARNTSKVEDRQLINLYKIFSPTHLLKQPVANDSNTLNKEFYNELLHLLGLEEVREKGRKLIRRKPVEQRNDGSLLEETYAYLKHRDRLAAIQNPQQYGATEEEQLFSIALELCITWMNRIMFLKLLEGQLIAYHKGDRGYAFLSSNRIENYDELNELFFDVLAVQIEDRAPSVNAKFGSIPYLNSSLFEETALR